MKLIELEEKTCERIGSSNDLISLSRINNFSNNTLKLILLSRDNTFLKCQDELMNLRKEIQILKFKKENNKFSYSEVRKIIKDNERFERIISSLFDYAFRRENKEFLDYIVKKIFVCSDYKLIRNRIQKYENTFFLKVIE